MNGDGGEETLVIEKARFVAWGKLVIVSALFGMVISKDDGQGTHVPVHKDHHSGKAFKREVEHYMQ